MVLSEISFSLHWAAMGMGARGRPFAFDVCLALGTVDTTRGLFSFAL
jgi:hypothetical protein